MRKYIQPKFKDKRSHRPKSKVCKCGKEFVPYTSLDKFCSANCRIENMKSKRSKRWNEEATKKRFGKNNPAYRHGLGSREKDGRVIKNVLGVGQKQFLRSVRTIKDEMISDCGHLFCQRCNKSNTTRYEGHHIIYRSEKPSHVYLHDKRNIILCCRECHNWFHAVKGNRNALVIERKLSDLFGTDILNK